MTNEQPDMKQEQFADPVRRAFAEHIVALACEWPDAVSRGELADAAAEMALWKAAYFGAAGLECDAVVAAERERLRGYFCAALADKGITWPGEVDILYDKCFAEPFGLDDA